MCQTTGRHKTCPPYHFPLAKSDYNPEKEEKEKEEEEDIGDSVHTKMNSASAIRTHASVKEIMDVLQTGMVRFGMSPRGGGVDG